MLYLIVSTAFIYAATAQNIPVLMTTTESVVTTEESVVITAESVVTTEEPVVITAKSVVTSEESVVTTADCTDANICDATCCEQDGSFAFLKSLEKISMLSSSDGAVCQDNNCEISCWGSDSSGSQMSWTGDELCTKGLNYAQMQIREQLMDCERSNTTDCPATDEDAALLDATISCDSSGSTPTCVVVIPTIGPTTIETTPACSDTQCRRDASGVYQFAVSKAEMITGNLDGAVCADDDCQISCYGTDGEGTQTTLTGDEVCSKALLSAQQRYESIISECNNKPNEPCSVSEEEDGWILDVTVVCGTSSDGSVPYCVLEPGYPETTNVGEDTKTTDSGTVATKDEDTDPTRGEDTETTKDDGTEPTGVDTEATKDDGTEPTGGDTETTKDDGTEPTGDDDTATTKDDGSEPTGGDETETTNDDDTGLETTEECERRSCLGHNKPCRPDPGHTYGCGLKVDLLLSVCVVDRVNVGGLEDSLWRALKTIVYPSTDALCDGDLMFIGNIEVWDDSTSERRLVDTNSEFETTQECPDVVDSCGAEDDDRSAYKVRVTLVVRCSDCTRLQEKAVTVYEAIDGGTLKPDFESNALANSKGHDTGCGVGLGRIIVDGTITISLYDETDGEMVIYEININSKAPQRVCFVGIAIGLIFLSFFN